MRYIWYSFWCSSTLLRLPAVWNLLNLANAYVYNNANCGIVFELQLTNKNLFHDLKLNFLEIALIIFFATILALFLGIPLQTIRKIIIDGGQCCDAVETKSAELEDERKVDAILGSDQSKIDGTNSSDSPTQKRRVSWSDKVVTEEPVIFRRPPTPVWLKDEENVQDFWDNDDEIEEIDTGYCNGVAENNR